MCRFMLCNKDVKEQMCQMMINYHRCLLRTCDRNGIDPGIVCPGKCELPTHLSLYLVPIRACLQPLVIWRYYGKPATQHPRDRLLSQKRSNSSSRNNRAVDNSLTSKIVQWNQFPTWTPEYTRKMAWDGTAPTKLPSLLMTRFVPEWERKIQFQSVTLRSMLTASSWQSIRSRSLSHPHSSFYSALW